MALREGLLGNMLYADGASNMRNFIVVVACYGVDRIRVCSQVHNTITKGLLSNPRKTAP